MKSISLCETLHIAEVHISANVVAELSIVAVTNIGLSKRKCDVKLISNLDWKGSMHFHCAHWQTILSSVEKF
jgi:hypothetical protein